MVTSLLILEVGVGSLVRERTSIIAFISCFLVGHTYNLSSITVNIERIILQIK